MNYQLPDLRQHALATTNWQTIQQRVALLHELTTGSIGIGELCCGDCSRQWQAYTEQLGCSRFLGLDIEPQIVARNRAKGIPCVQGDVMDRQALAQFQDFAVLFFGPPLSQRCGIHRPLAFRDIQPRYDQVARLLLGELGYDGLLVCICPKTTDMGDITWLYQQIRLSRPDIGLRLIHHSYATVTGGGDQTEMRLKYVELWFSSQLEDAWELRVGKPI
ncbi:MAG: hypothetical protein KJ063_08210 [Anaerolineae bacterium]|nr:hypothetical protein [Anaerolineae bacterium]